MLVNRQIKMKYLWKTMEVFRTKKKLKGVFCCGKSSNPYLNSGILLIKQIKNFICYLQGVILTRIDLDI